MKRILISIISFFRKAFTFTLVSSFLIIGAIDVDAAPITFAFDGSGTWTYPNPDPDYISFSGSYTFDSTAPDIDPDPKRGNYALSSLNFSFGSLSGTSNGGNIIVVDGDNSSASYSVYSFFTGYLGQESVTGNVQLVRYCEYAGCASRFESDALPLTPPQGLPWDYSSIRINEYPTGAPNIRLISLTITAVPEPISSILFLSGAGTLAVRRLFKRKPA